MTELKPRNEIFNIGVLGSHSQSRFVSYNWTHSKSYTRTTLPARVTIFSSYTRHLPPLTAVRVFPLFLHHSPKPIVLDAAIVVVAADVGGNVVDPTTFTLPLAHNSTIVSLSSGSLPIAVLLDTSECPATWTRSRKQKQKQKAASAAIAKACIERNWLIATFDATRDTEQLNAFFNQVVCTARQRKIEIAHGLMSDVASTNSNNALVIVACSTFAALCASFLLVYVGSRF